MNLKTKYILVALFLVSFVTTATAYEYDPNDFATDVVNYIQGDQDCVDPLSFEDYNQPATALGEPNRLTNGDMFIGYDIWMEVVPVYPQWRASEIVTVGGGGQLILYFNHPVADDDNNPYGIDFIIFGNSRWRIASGGTWTPQSNPETVTVGTGFYAEPGLVSVSQDYNDWYTFSNGPYADHFAPTASYEWDDFNDVWAEELDPTRPIDPNLTITSFDGNSVAQIIDRYDGSAGGVGFDLKDLDPCDYAALATDPVTGKKWIQYVKIVDDPLALGLPEIDAISDVSCCGDYKHPYPAGDFTEDCSVNYEDLALLRQYWLIEITDSNEPANSVDIYDDDIVNFFDYSMMADNWLK